MQIGATLALLFSPLIISGCVTVQDSKSLIITPAQGETMIAVTSKAKAHCQDFLLFMWCKLELSLEQTK